MAAVSTAPAASVSLTPPTSSHGHHNTWNFSVPSHQEASYPKTNSMNRTQPPQKHDSPPRITNSRSDFSARPTDAMASVKTNEGAYLAPARVNALQHKDSVISDSGSNSDSLLDLYGNRANIAGADHNMEKAHINGDLYDDTDPESSRWIHRDKLAKIESEELQQAGILLPRVRATSKSSRRDTSRDQQTNGIRSEQTQKRQRMDSIPNEVEEGVYEDNYQWDLRTPEEAAEDQGDPYEKLNGKQGVSRIPVCKTSPSPIALTHLERDTPIKRRMSSGVAGEEDGLTYSKIRGRSQSIKPLGETSANSSPTSTLAPTSVKKTVAESPSKKTPTRVTSISGNRSVSSAQRPKTRSGREVSGARPNTRSGEIGAVSAIRPEGDPPWLASMYKPDPMLPPDQQLLPTVAKRLQQEQWEREGKFGTAYDTQFRPLNDEQPKPRPESLVLQNLEVPAPKNEDKEKDGQWPLKALPPKSPTLSVRPGTAGQQTYSVMPKIHTGIPQGVGPLPSPRPPVRVQEPPEDTKKGGCGCCVIM